MIKVAIHQPNLLPHIGLVQKLVQCDVFVVLTLVDMNYRDYIHRVKLLNGYGNLELIDKPKIIRDVKVKSDNNLYKALRGRCCSKVLDILDPLFGRLLHLDNMDMVTYNLESWALTLNALLGKEEAGKHLSKVVFDYNLVDVESFRKLNGSQKMATLTKLASRYHKGYFAYQEDVLYVSGRGGLNYMELSDFASRDVAVTFQPRIVHDPLKILGLGSPHYLEENPEEVIQHYITPYLKK